MVTTGGTNLKDDILRLYDPGLSLILHCHLLFILSSTYRKGVHCSIPINITVELLIPVAVEEFKGYFRNGRCLVMNLRRAVQTNKLQ